MAFQDSANSSASSSFSPPSLEPILKPGRTEQYSYKPGAFQTKKGRLLVPRQNNPPRPSPETISEVRRGRLVDSFQDGRIYRASDFVGDVSPRIARMSLDDTYDYQTRLLSPFPFIPDDARSLRNLFFVALKQDELPSYHFWTGPQDPDPVTEEKPTDWNEILQNSKPAGWEEMPGQNSDERSSSRKPSDEDKNKLQETQSPTSPNQIHGALLEDNPFQRSDRHKQATQSSKEAVSAPASSTQCTFPSPFKIPSLNTATQGDSQISPKGTYHRAVASQESGIRRASALLPGMLPSLNSKNPTSGIPLLGDAPLRKISLLDVAAKPSPNEPKESSVLIRCDRGGMYLHDFSKAAFKEMMLHMINNEANDTEAGSRLRFLDILKPEQPTSEAVSLPRKSIDFDRVFARDIQPFLGMKGYHFRVRSDAYRERTPWDNGKKGSLKITRVDVGYCYVDPDGSWSDPQQLYSNSARFKDALKFLFDQERREDDPPPPDDVTLVIPPSLESFDIDRWSLPLVPVELGKILDEISQASVSSGPFEPIQHTYAAEVYIHETGTDFVHPLVLVAHATGPPTDEEAMGPPTDEGREEAEGSHAHEEGLPKQQEAQEAGNTEDIAQQSKQRQWSMVPPRTTFEYNPGSVASSTRPKVRTQSEIGDLERRLRIAEERVENQELQIGYLANENSGLEGRAITAERQAAELEGQRLQLRVQQRDLESEVRGLRAERDELRKKMDGLNAELGQDRETRTLLASTLENVESQVLALTEERNHLQSRVDAAESATNGQDQGTESTNNNTARDPLHQSEDTSGRPAAGPSASEDRPAHLLPLQDATAPTADPPSGSADAKRLLYCAACIKSVDKLDDNGRTKHAEKCSTTVSSFIYLTIQEAKEMRKGASAPSAKDKGKGRAVSTDEAGPSTQAEHAAEDTSTSAKAGKVDTDRKRKRPAKDEGKPDEVSAPSTTRPKRNVKKPVKDPQEGAPPPAKKVKTRATRTQAPPPGMMEPDGDSSAGELGPMLKRKTNDEEDLPRTKSSTSRARGQASAAAETRNPDRDSSRKRKARDDVEPPVRKSERKKPKK